MIEPDTLGVWLRQPPCKLCSKVLPSFVYGSRIYTAGYKAVAYVYGYLASNATNYRRSHIGLWNVEVPAMRVAVLSER